MSYFKQLALKVKKKVESIFPNIWKRVTVRNSAPPKINLPYEKEKLIKKWHFRVKLEFPGIYNNCLKEENYLAAFLIVCKLLEFHLMQYIFEFSIGKENERVNQIIQKYVEKLRLLPNFLTKLIIKLVIKLARTPHGIRTPGYYVDNEFTLGMLIREAKKKGLKKSLIRRLGEFNGRRKMLVHNMLTLDHLDKDINRECKKACDSAESIWDQLRE